MTTWLRVTPETIPDELRGLGWVLWRPEQRGDGKPTKVPYQIAHPRRKASTTDPATWGTFEDAVEAYRTLVDWPAVSTLAPVAGIGVVLTTAARITCIDLDRVVAPNDTLDPRAARIVGRCGSWTEVSPSGTGIHIFLRGTVARALKGDQFECYADGRYIAVTGRTWPGTPSSLSEQQGYLDTLVRMDQQDQPPRPTWHGAPPPPPDDLAGALLNKLQGWNIPATRLKAWHGGYLVELAVCPWADEHTSGPGGAVVISHPSGAFDFSCPHSHCAGRSWRDFRSAMEGRG